MKRGKIITIEGTDCSGKETQAKMLLEKLTLENIASEIMSFPRYNTPTGRIVGQSYLGKENLGKGDLAWFGDSNKLNPKIASLYYAADRLAAAPEMERIVLAGKNLLLDRYIESNMGHQAGKIKSPKEKLEMVKFLNQLEYDLLELPKPDSIIFLYMPYEVANELKKGRKEKPDGHESNPEHLKNAEQTYLQLAKMYNWKQFDCAPDGTIKSLKTPQEIHKEIYEHIKKVIL